MAKKKVDFNNERIMGLAAIVLGVLVIVAPSLLNYIIAAWLIIWGASRFL